MQVMIRSECVSPHLNPFLSALNLLLDNLTFVYTSSEQGKCRREVGWNLDTDFIALQDHEEMKAKARTVEVLVEMLREIDIMEERVRSGRLTFYCGERWFKPRMGMLRLFSPSYLMMAWRFVRLLTCKSFSVLPMGIHAARDFIRLAFLFKGDMRMLFASPKVAFESRPGGIIVPLKEVVSENILTKQEIEFANRNGYVQIPREHWGRFHPSGVYSKMRLFGYFVDSGKKTTLISSTKRAPKTDNKQKVLWAGRMLWWKRTVDIIRVAKRNKRLSVDIYGDGPYRARLEKACKGVDNVSIRGYIRNEQLRHEMHTHHVYILPSNSYEGWGAVVSEALSEGIRILATAEAGASATILPIDNLFNAGEVAELNKKLSRPIKYIGLGLWNGEYAAKAFLDIAKEYA